MLTKSRPNTAIVRIPKTKKVRQKCLPKLACLNDPITLANECTDPVTAAVATSKDPESAATAVEDSTADSNAAKTATSGSTSENSKFRVVGGFSK